MVALFALMFPVMKYFGLQEKAIFERKVGRLARLTKIDSRGVTMYVHESGKLRKHLKTI